MAKRKADAKAQLKVRLREHLRARIEAEAKKHDVSLNDEIVDRLEQSFARETQAAALRDQLEHLKVSEFNLREEVLQLLKKANLALGLLEGRVEPKK